MQFIECSLCTNILCKHCVHEGGFFFLVQVSGKMTAGSAGKYCVCGAAHKHSQVCGGPVLQGTCAAAPTAAAVLALLQRAKADGKAPSRIRSQ